MKKLLAILVIFLFCVSFGLQAADMNAKFSFMELFITQWNDKSNIKEPLHHGGGAGMDWFGNVFDSSMSLAPVVQDDALTLTTFFFNEVVTDVGGANIQWWFDTRFDLAGGMFKLRLSCEQDTQFDYTNLSTLSVKQVNLTPDLKLGVNIPNILGMWIVNTINWTWDTKNNSAVQIDEIAGFKIGGPGLDTYRNDTCTIWHGGDGFIRHWLGPQYSFGLGWVVAQEYDLQMNTKWVAHGDPNNNETLLTKLELDTYAGVIFNVLALTSIKDLSLSILAIEELDIGIPYSTGAEQNKTFNTTGLYGVELGYKGFTWGVYAELGTHDDYNSTVAISGTGALGPAFKFQYFADNWGGVNYAFRFEYHGAYSKLRTADDAANNYAGENIWTNVFRADWFIFF